MRIVLETVIPKFLDRHERVVLARSLHPMHNIQHNKSPAA